MTYKQSPANAERLEYGNYEWRVERNSEFDPSAMITVERGVKCPRCETKIPDIEHGALAGCPKCQLNMERWGNMLYCWSTR